MAAPSRAWQHRGRGGDLGTQDRRGLGSAPTACSKGREGGMGTGESGASRGGHSHSTQHSRGQNTQVEEGGEGKGRERKLGEIGAW